MKLINKDVLIEDLTGAMTELDKPTDSQIEKIINDGLKGGLNIALQIIENYPTFEMENAYWIKGDMCECSFCHNKQQDMSAYCPKCGSTMDGWYHG